MSPERTQPAAWPAILSLGFRPFFLLGALHAGLIMLLWPLVLSGAVPAPGALTPVDWHVHETLFGYLAAIIAGFLLTAIPNWTGRPPVRGAPLLGLVLLWLAGRAAMFLPAGIAAGASPLCDVLFLGALLLVAGREIIAGRNLRNLKILAPLAVFLLADALFHAQALVQGGADHPRRLGLAAAIVLILIIGGRIIPNFTRNWLMPRGPGALPVTFNRFDGAAVVVSAAALLWWSVTPHGLVTGGLMILAAALNLARLARWAGYRTWREPLVLILHLAYLFVPVGFGLAGLAALDPQAVPVAAGIHGLGAGAISVMTLAVMTRATLGHTGRPLHADGVTCLIYAAVLAAALVRMAAAFLPSLDVLLTLSAGLWSFAFLTFSVWYGRMLLRPRLS